MLPILNTQMRELLLLIKIFYNQRANFIGVYAMNGNAYTHEK